ncbi:hypothetical protein PK98_14785 [Croceibacterium mercuriale]|uniref:Uncharacterized protein n=1 Tax=Croceibacterium mercuriale TaxID=1572751 RepID=A0A0B2BX83_9SPHN|nr:hypothetical protein PK98_14785 [Croceibacterium mercuriale]
MACCKAGQRAGEPGLRINAVQLGGFDERGDHRPVLATFVRAGEERVLAAQRERTDRSFDRVSVELDPAVIEEAGQPLPAGERIADRLGKDAFAARLDKDSFRSARAVPEEQG